MDKRKHARAVTAYSAKITRLDGQPSSIECSVTDLSQGGARLSFDRSRTLPDEFRLSLENGVRRLCKVVWKKGNESASLFGTGSALKEQSFVGQNHSAAILTRRQLLSPLA
jgi:hypothetical protein